MSAFGKEAVMARAERNKDQVWPGFSRVGGRLCGESPVLLIVTSASWRGSEVGDVWCFTGESNWGGTQYECNGRTIRLDSDDILRAVHQGAIAPTGIIR